MERSLTCAVKRSGCRAYVSARGATTTTSARRATSARRRTVRCPEAQAATSTAGGSARARRAEVYPAAPRPKSAPDKVAHAGEERRRALSPAAAAAVTTADVRTTSHAHL